MGILLESLADFWLRTVFQLLGQAAEQSVSDQRQIGQKMGIARTRPIFAHQDIPAPMVANFYAAPMSANELQPLGGAVVFRFGTG